MLAGIWAIGGRCYVVVVSYLCCCWGGGSDIRYGLLLASASGLLAGCSMNFSPCSV